MAEKIIQVTCKHCGSTDAVKAGVQAGTQRYLCHKCHRKFKADDMPFHMKVSAGHISSALAMYYTGSSITDIRNHIRQETGYYPSKSRVFYWIEKYTDTAANYFGKVKPKVGDTWIADETMIDLDKGVKVWFWDIIDADTRFLLASRVSLTRTTQDAKQLVQDAVKRAGKPPQVILTDKMKSYPDGIFTALGGYTEHIQGSPFKLATESTSRIERFHETLKERTKVMKAFRDIDTLIDFAKGFLAYYNFLKPHEALKGKTPAEKAKLRYDVKTWADVVNIPVPAEVERARRISPRMKLTQPKVSIEGAFKRKRPREPFQRRLPIGGVYSDRKGQRLSRKPHRGWRRIV
jgi:putative transposase